MEFYPYDMTLFCKEKDKETGKERYRRIYFYGIDWQESVGVKYLKYTNSSVDNDTNILIFTPYRNDLEYLKPKEYAQLDDKTNYYTFNIHDKIVKGIVDFNVETAKDLRDLELKFDCVTNIIKISNCDIFGHFELECE